MRGYQGQYALAARVIYQVMAAGELAWVGLADRGAGVFDDLVIGRTDGAIRGYQVKSSLDPGTFSIKTLLLGADGLLPRLVESLERLEREHEGRDIEVVFVTDDLPRPNDRLVPRRGATSTAAFLRLHGRERLRFGLPDWRVTDFAPFVEAVRKASGLSDQRFEVLLQRLRFVTGRERALEGHSGLGVGDAERLSELANLLPVLVADPADRDRWPLSELLRRLRWNDPFVLRHVHAFPLGEFVQPNADTEAALQAVLDRTTRGYVSLVGPPGSGKSTLLEAGLLPTASAIVVRYLAYVPSEAQGLGRAEAFDFLHDVVGQLKAVGLGRGIVQSNAIADLRTQFAQLLAEASRKYLEDGVRTIIVADGLDHVPRENRSLHPFLRELPEPEAVPDGVIFLLGSQRVDLEGLPPSVQHAAQAAEIQMSPLSRDAVARWADEAGVPGDAARDVIWAKSLGHPLSVRYAIEALRLAPDEDARRDWLRSGPAYDGDVEAFYRRAWQDLAKTPQAQKALGYLALSEGFLHPTSLDRLVGAPEVTDQAWEAAKHLLVRDARGGWAVFHNSFRLFLAAQTGVRHGLPNEAARRARYDELADLAAAAPADDPQHWLELRYRARAGNTQAVLSLGTLARFRTQLIEGRVQTDIKDDIRLAFGAAGAQQDHVALVRLVLASLEVYTRAEALGEEVFEALIGLGDFAAAERLLSLEDAHLEPAIGFRLVDALLEAGDGLSARRVFAALEPLDYLHGRTPVDQTGAEEVLTAWAYRALAFRTPEKVLAGIQRLQPPRTLHARHFDLRRLRGDLKASAAMGELCRRPELDPTDLCDALDVAADLRPFALAEAALGAARAGNPNLVAGRLRHLAEHPGRVGGGQRRMLAGLALDFGHADLAARFLTGLSGPCLNDFQATYAPEELRDGVGEIFRDAQARAEAGLPPAPGRADRSSLYTTVQQQVETLGRVSGTLKRGAPIDTPFQALCRTVLDTLQLGVSDRDVDTDRMQLNRFMDEVVGRLVQVAGEQGPETLARFLAVNESRFQSGRLSQPHVRRRLALEAHRHGAGLASTIARLEAVPSPVESTPAEQLSELAQQASAWLAIGELDRAREVMAGLHGQSLGYARAAKKDPQYILWREVLAQACRADPARRAERCALLLRLVTGLARTEGDSAARRVVAALIGEAVRLEPSAVREVCDVVERHGLVTWPDLAIAVAIAVAEHVPTSAPVAALAYGRIGVPWLSDHDTPELSQFVDAAADVDVAGLAELLLDVLDTDGHTAWREKAETDVREAAARRGVDLTGRARRWRDPVDPTITERESAALAATRTPGEVMAILGSLQDGQRYGLPRAFLRLAPVADFDGLKALFEAAEGIAEDARCIAAMIESAERNGRAQDVEAYLTRLMRKTVGGGWTAWGGSSTRLYHEHRIRLEGDRAREAAFVALCDDLAAAREWPAAVLPELCDLLELTCASPDWAAVWDELEGQLREFREFDLGEMVALAPEGGSGDEAAVAVLADLLFRAAGVGASLLRGDVRRAADDLMRHPRGAEVVARLIKALVEADAALRLEGAQIAWAHRDDPTVREAVASTLPALLADPDFAVRQRAEGLAAAAGPAVASYRAPLPAGYRLLMPEDSADDFSRPFGASETSQGLWTDDPALWTWPLERALPMLERASGIPLAVLRARVGAKMREAGGRSAFGPEAERAFNRRFDRLNLITGYTKPMADHAFRATRQVVGELMAAEAMDPAAADWVMMEAAAPPLLPLATFRRPRPEGVAPPALPERYGSNDDAWLEGVDAEAVVVSLPGRNVLAAVTTFQRRNFEDEWTIERYVGPEVPGAWDELAGLLATLPRLARFSASRIAGRSEPDEGLVAAVRPQPALDTPRFTLAFAGSAAAALGWRWDPVSPYRLVDQGGALMAETVFWTEGGHLSARADDGYVGEGCLLVLSEDGWNEAATLRGERLMMRGWRRVERGSDVRSRSARPRVAGYSGAGRPEA